MNFITKIFIILFFLTLNNQKLNAKENYKFLNIDTIVQETKIGQLMLSKIKELDQSNIQKLKILDDELRKKESEVKSKKNILSEQEFENEINKYRNNINEFKKKKEMMVKKLKDTKNEELKIFFNTINPIIENYMEKNAIDIIFNSKTIYMGIDESDLTEKLIKEINNKI
ncbi:OmpH family outer membrane protein [Candidatus Pelagibacter sp. HIMB1495]|uniref:OmpH family outer membrane protein n=1 Tax=unclassified Candidatus Pelagibacter TaxID=2647897 RepID=UPI003F83EEF7